MSTLTYEKQSAPRLRKPYYQATDALMGLRTAIEETGLTHDGDLVACVEGLAECLAELADNMSARYNWD